MYINKKNIYIYIYPQENKNVESIEYLTRTRSTMKNTIRAKNM